MLHKDEAAELKKSCKPTGIYYDTHDCNFNGKHNDGGWPAELEQCNVSLAGLFQSICPVVSIKHRDVKAKNVK